MRRGRRGRDSRRARDSQRSFYVSAFAFGRVDVETGYLVFLTFFQIVGAVVLAHQTGPDRGLARIAAGLLTLNGVLTAGEASFRLGFSAEWSFALFLAVDSFTIVFLAAFLLEDVPSARLRAFLVAGAVVANAPFAAHVLLTDGQPDRWVDTLARSVPYYAATAAVCVTFASRDRPRRWIALAFLPRAFYLGLIPWWSFTLGTEPQGAAVLDYAARAALGFAALWALVRLSRGSVSPTWPAALALTAPGPLLFVASRLIPSGAWNDLLNFSTLSLLRPAILYVGLAAGLLLPILRRSIVTAGITIAITGGFEALRVPPAGALALGLGAGFMVYGLWESVRPSRLGPAVGSIAPVPRAESAEPAARAWMRVLLDLDEQAEGGAWTQAEIVSRTGLRVQRVSDALRSLTDAALTARRSEALGFEAAGPLIEVKVRIPREGGAPVNAYSLTPSGRALAKAIRARFDGQIRLDSGPEAA